MHAKKRWTNVWGCIWANIINVRECACRKDIAIWKSGISVCKQFGILQLNWSFRNKDLYLTTLQRIKTCNNPAKKIITQCPFTRVCLSCVSLVPNNPDHQPNTSSSIDKVSFQRWRKFWGTKGKVVTELLKMLAARSSSVPWPLSVPFLLWTSVILTVKLARLKCAYQMPAQA